MRKVQYTGNKTWFLEINNRINIPLREKEGGGGRRWEFRVALLEARQETTMFKAISGTVVCCRHVTVGSESTATANAINPYPMVINAIVQAWWGTLDGTPMGSPTFLAAPLDWPDCCALCSESNGESLNANLVSPLFQVRIVHGLKVG